MTTRSFSRKNKIFGVHLPIKSGVLFSSCLVVIKPCLLRKRLHEMRLAFAFPGSALRCASQIFVRAGRLARLPVLPCPAQLGTYAYLVCRSESRLSTAN